MLVHVGKLTQIGGHLSTASKLMKRIEQENWRPVTIEADGFELDLNEVHAMTEVGFVLWHKQDCRPHALITSGHTAQGVLVGSEEEPLPISSETHDTIEKLLTRN